MIQRSVRCLAAIGAISFLTTGIALCQTVLTADGQTDAYTRIESVLGASPETPDRSHPAFGPHITQTIDDYLKKYVFVFNIHVTPDNDRCTKFDRQRLEIKTAGSSPDYVKGFLNDTVTFRWKFKLPAGFQPSTSFTHIHQIKAFDGDAASPLITLTPRKADPNRIELIHINSSGVTTKLATAPLDPFLGEWVEAYEKITYGHNGKYSIVITRMNDSSVLFSYSNDNLDLWRTGTTIVRPKWGIYRSLNHPEDLRDEQVLFDHFCLAKGSDDCPSDQVTPEFSLSASARPGAVIPGGTATYDIATTGLRGFAGNTNLSVLGLPAGTTAAFTPSSISGGSGFSTLSVSTGNDIAAGNYPLVIEGISGVLSHVVSVPLAISDFSIGISTSSQSVSAGGKTVYDVALNALNGFRDAVYLTANNLPPGASGYFSPPKLNRGAGPSVLHLFTSTSTPPGTYQMQITGTDGALVHTQVVTLVVTN